jgi:hypothetical protein
MSPKDFLVKFFLIVASALVAAYVFTYFQVREYNTSKQVLNGAKNFAPNHKAVPASGPVVGAQPEAAVADDQYSLEKYPVSYGAGGNLKMISPDLGSITLIGADNNDIRAIITGKTEVFRNGGRAELSAIKDTDSVEILGRRQSEGRGEFVADSIYANSTQATYDPIMPVIDSAWEK